MQTQPWMTRMAEQLRTSEVAERAQVIEAFQRLTGRSPATLYRIAKQHGFRTGRKPRRDRGHCTLTDEQVQIVSTLIQTSAREVKGCILPVGEAMEIAIDNGVIERGEISEARLHAILREREMNKAAIDAPPPCIRMRSLHPNHVHVFDASICIQYYLKHGRGLSILDERDFREKKPANFSKIKNRLYRLILADHFSHWLYVRYYEAAGENQIMTFDFLTSAWRGGHHGKLPFRGVPKILLMDAGSANVARGILELLRRLEIDLPENMPHNPRRQGSAEVAQNIVETHFEARLRFEPATTIEELNQWCLDWLVRWNGTKKHSRHGMTRTECWLKFIRQEHLRDLPSEEILLDAYAEPEVACTVRADNTISFKTNTYRLKRIEGIRPGLKVMLVKRPAAWPQVGVLFNDVEYLVAPVGTLVGGFSADAALIGQEFKRQPDTMADRARKINENLAYGDEHKRGALPFGGTLMVHGLDADKVMAIPMPRRGTPIEVGRDLTAKEIPIMELFKRLRDAGVMVTPALNAQMRGRFGESVAVGEAEEIVRRFEERGTRMEERQRSVV